jgi:arylsulfatase A-like enzyme
LKTRYHFNQGFDHFDDRMEKKAEGISVYGSQRSAESIVRALNSYLKSEPIDEEQGLFLFLHFFDVHAPYMPPDPFNSMYLEDNLGVTGTLQDVAKISVGLKKNNPDAKGRSDVLEALYAGEVSYVDYNLGRVFGLLREHGLYDDSLIIVTSDHGETMAEHTPSEVWDHGYTLFDSTIRIPLVMRFPKEQYSGIRSKALLSNVDVMPTVLDFLGIPVPEKVEGWSFAGLLTKEEYKPRTLAFSEATKPSLTRVESGTVWRNERKHRSVRADDWRYIYRPLSKRSSLYPMSVDYVEQRDRLRTDPTDDDKRLGEEFFVHLESWHQEAVPTESKEDESEESALMLEALGYVDKEDPAEN